MNNLKLFCTIKMSETDENKVPETNVLENDKNNVEKKTPNPNRVKAGHKLAAIGQKAKEEKMRKRLKEEMTSPSYWVLLGVVLSSVGYLSICLWFPFSFTSKEEKKEPPKEKETSKESKRFFG